MRTSPPLDDSARRFREAYGRHRAAEGRGSGGTAELLALPFLRHGPLSRQWQVRARTADRFLRRVLDVRAMEVGGRPVRVADLGAGNGWLCYRAALRGHRGIAVDVRTDSADGLGAAAAYAPHVPAMFPRIAASFDALPLAAGCCDIAVFNASLHYALDLGTVLAEAARLVLPGGRVVILDSPFYATEAQGLDMVAEKRRHAVEQFGTLAAELTALPALEFLTRARLEAASAPLRLVWRRRRVRYPLWYETRRLQALLRARRTPSRFDIWEALVCA